jgi:hypothetical protein
MVIDDQADQPERAIGGKRHRRCEVDHFKAPGFKQTLEWFTKPVIVIDDRYHLIFIACNGPAPYGLETSGERGQAVFHFIARDNREPGAAGDLLVGLCRRRLDKAAQHFGYAPGLGDAAARCEGRLGIEYLAD